MFDSHSVYMIKRKMALTFVTLCTVLMVLNLLLLQQNRALKANTQKLDRLTEIKPGTRVPPIKGVNAAGEKVTVEVDDAARKTVLLVLSPSCGACKENMSNWKALATKLDGESYKVVAISLKPDLAKDYLESYQLGDIPLITELDPETKAAYSLSLTPQTIIIGSNGEAENVWSGVLSGQKRKEVESVFNVKLAGTF